MFKKHSVKLSLERNPKPTKDANDPETPNPYLDPETTIPLVKDLAVDGAKLGFAIYAGVKQY